MLVYFKVATIQVVVHSLLLNNSKIKLLNPNITATIIKKNVDDV